MHISEGILSAPVLIGGAALTAGGTGVALKQLKNEDIPKVGVLSAAFFVAGLIHVPIGVASVHLVLNGLVGIILGWQAFPATSCSNMVALQPSA
jgi:cobalt/nickel transport system permease protein